MLDKYKRLIEESIAYRAVLPTSTWLMHTIDSFVAEFYDKPQKDDLAYFKRWEREKILSLGLASAPDPLKRSQAKNIRFRSSWDQEKAASLGLSASYAAKSPPQMQPPSLLKQILLQVINQLNMQLRAFLEKQNAQNAQNQPDENTIPEKSSDDFFKTLGYE